MKNRYVEYLIERLENAELDNRAMKLVLEDLTKELSRSNRMLEKLNELQSLLEEERKSRKSLERENIKLKEQLKSARKNRFGSRKQSVKKMIPVGMMILLTVRRRKMALMARTNHWIPVPYRSRKHRNPTLSLRIRGISSTVRKPIVPWA